VINAIEVTPEILEWDSEFFGRRIARIEADVITPAYEREVTHWCRRNGVACLYVLSGSDSSLPLVDVRVTYEWKTSGAEQPAPSVRPFIPSDIAALEAIARKCHRDSRFYADGRFDAARCNEMYATWIRKSCNGWADHVCVATSQDEPTGYLTCHANGSIGLLAVAEQARGQSLGRQLVVAAQNYFRANGPEHVDVVTQGRNIAARGLYESCGFRLAGTRYWYHVWFPENMHA
jgi:dTDP-4-amino-4,6-dideoxy-D-galactose acyltransferase